ncbi:AraC family transcriptional regulator [Streptomyces lunaelactis]|uniref:AraC family transcriptional regulator n=1 Tax=Streptomyces lunaelactis TaxID=1535768 RepID=UPI0028161E3C|nr:helix-turn-helix domain-containing protein [Streptomyces lunaelactis]
MYSAPRVDIPGPNVGSAPREQVAAAATTLPRGVVNESVRVRAAAALRPYVAWYTGYRQDGFPATLHRGMPSPYLTLIFTLDDLLTVAGHPDPRQAPGNYDTLLGGLHTSPALITHQGRQSGIQIALHPLGARALLGLPAGELANTNLPADAVLGRLCGELQARLEAADSWPERFAVLDKLLLRATRPYVGVPPEVARAWQLLIRTGGAVPVSALADEIGWSGRPLADRFRRETGLTPKAAARVVRFDRARRLLAAGAGRSEPPRLADVAAECGYFDQAHLAREFRSLAGCAPSRWLAEEFRNVQAPSSGPAQDWLRQEPNQC